MKVGDLVSYRHDKTGKTRGIVLYVRKKYIDSGPPERAMVYWNNAAENDEVEDWAGDLEVINESR